MQSINLNEQIVNIKEIQFSYNKKLQQEKKIKNHVAKIKNVARVWRMRNLTIEAKIAIFKSLAISKIVQLAFINTVLICTEEQLIS